jgi:hypothetical protein
MLIEQINEDEMSDGETKEEKVSFVKTSGKFSKNAMPLP